MDIHELEGLLTLIQRELPGSTIQTFKKRVSLIHDVLSNVDLSTGKSRGRPKPIVALFDRPAFQEVHVLCPPPVLSMLGYDKEPSYEYPDRDGNQKVRWDFAEAEQKSRKLGRELREVLDAYLAGHKFGA